MPEVVYAPGPLPPETDVLIAGAGPVGAVLALDLARRGVRTVVAEQYLNVPEHNVRAQNLSMHSMERLRALGVAERVRAHRSSVPQEWFQEMAFRTSIAGRALARLARPGELGGWREVAVENHHIQPQYLTTRALREAAAEAGATIVSGVQLTDHDDSGEAVRATFRDARDGRRHTVRARYLVGCDGGASAVRERAGITRDVSQQAGHFANVHIRVPELFERLGTAPAAINFVVNERAQSIFLAYEADRWRFGIGPFASEAEIDERAVRDAIDAVLGADVGATIESYSSYAARCEIARGYRRGRVLLAGDAAHLFPPNMGQNMNVGIGDAANLAWKLTAVLEGWGGEALLDSYDVERRPIAWQTGLRSLETVVEQHEALAEIIARRRDDLADPGSPAADVALAQEVAATFLPRWRSEGVVLDQRYDGSPIVAADGTVAPVWSSGDYAPLARPGHRAPHAEVDGVPLYDLLDAAGPGYALLRLGGDGAALDADGADADADDATGLLEAARAQRLPLAELRLSDPALRELYGAPMVLVRPDRHVAWRGTAAPPDPDALIATLRGAA
ncbi:FAD-dependent monooxygenase [Conexibacter stalactiti]|uniref:FAD-dependent monooxygenase n=1 Tax=Conexibacter stalactiti TaxID=1940611 RepID=A0ABU4HNG6_9ACTN|nr:FAD-dependent monooxygenase [Conexibacter stalactiti]MDW5594863.1 FAD-dependent monooxygenase [Conexibacter stalactiti]MEC5035505.1 FAD-dependent monooxygenase [Conexibacter stalactiti]